VVGVSADGRRSDIQSKEDRLLGVSPIDDRQELHCRIDVFVGEKLFLFAGRTRRLGGHKRGNGETIESSTHPHTPVDGAEPWWYQSDLQLLIWREERWKDHASSDEKRSPGSHDAVPNGTKPYGSRS